MKVSLDKLSSTGRILSIINGVTTLTVGDISLPVKAGPVTQQVLFSVVEDLGPYNAIVGRAWLHVCLFLYRLKTPQIRIVTRALHFSCNHVTLDNFA